MLPVTQKPTFIKLSCTNTCFNQSNSLYNEANMEYCNMFYTFLRKTYIRKFKIEHEMMNTATLMNQWTRLSNQ